MISLATPTGIRRAIPVLAHQVACRRMTYSAALDLLVRAFLGIKLTEPEFILKPAHAVGRWIVRLEARLGLRLSEATDAGVRVRTADSLRRRLLDGRRMRLHAEF